MKFIIEKAKKARFALRNYPQFGGMASSIILALVLLPNVAAWAIVAEEDLKIYSRMEILKFSFRVGCSEQRAIL